eukprot:7985954-Ditylum_brightwellii.AAC.1
MARTKHTQRHGAYQRVDDVPKDNGPKEDGDVLKGSSFDGVQHSLRINPTLSNDAKKTNELGNDADSKDESYVNYTGGDNSRESSIKDNNSSNDGSSKETSVKDNSKEDEIA